MKYQICAEQRVSAMILNSEIHNCSQQSMECSPKINHILSHEAILCKCRNINVASSILFIHDGPKLEISFRRKCSSPYMASEPYMSAQWMGHEIDFKVTRIEWKWKHIRTCEVQWKIKGERNLLQ